MGQEAFTAEESVCPITDGWKRLSHLVTGKWSGVPGAGRVGNEAEKKVWDKVKKT